MKRLLQKRKARNTKEKGMTGKPEVGDIVIVQGGDLMDFGIEEGKEVEVAGEMTTDTGNFAIVDTGGEYGLVAVNWSRLVKA